jgi:tetratricopeptide (TPR) repeat protein
MSFKKNQVVVLATLLVFVFFSGPLFAKKKATDYMTEALKDKAAGKIERAAKKLYKAADTASGDLQKHLALFMLGDCLMELERYDKAVEIYRRLRKNVSDNEEKAEAAFRLMQAQAARGKQKEAIKLFAYIKNHHSKSPYFDLARSFVKAGRLAMKGDALSSKSVEKQYKSEPQKTVAKADTETTIEHHNKVRSQAATRSKSAKNKIAGDKASLLKEILRTETSANPDELVTRILILQDKLKENGSSAEGMDKVLFELAELTDKFGEKIEACKYYDKILHEHSSSLLVEDAYYKAIRLRAILGVHKAVKSWGKAFLAAFPASQYTEKVKALIAYSDSGGEVDLSSVKTTELPQKNIVSNQQVVDQSDELIKNPTFKTAEEKMKAGKYQIALSYLNKLKEQFPRASKLWWNLALVQVQSEDFPAAKQAVQKMLAITPDSDEGNSLLGYINYRLKDYGQATDAYNKAGSPGGSGINFYDSRTAAERLKKSAGKR